MAMQSLSYPSRSCPLPITGYGRGIKIFRKSAWDGDQCLIQRIPTQSSDLSTKLIEKKDKRRNH